MAMQPLSRRGMLTITLLAGIGLAAAAAQTRKRGIGGTDASAMDETTGSVGDPHAAGELALSDEQRGRIYAGVMRLPDAPVAEAPPPAVAEPLPQGVPLQDLPAGVTRAIPLVRGHKFVKFDDRIVVVDPRSRMVVAMIPRYKLLP